MDAISLSCPSCGSNLEITSDLDRFACGYCGKQILVNRSGGIVSLKPLIEKIDSIGGAVDRTASELAIKRIKEEISEIEESIKSANSRESSLGKVIGYGVAGLLIGIIMLLLGIVNKEGTVIFCGVLPFLLSGGLMYFAYWAEKGWKDKISKMQISLAAKRTQLKKHLKIVNG